MPGQADHALTGGENYCTLYEAWADRGMGPDAKLRGALPWGGVSDYSLFSSTPLTFRHRDSARKTLTYPRSAASLMHRL